MVGNTQKAKEHFGRDKLIDVQGSYEASPESLSLGKEPGRDCSLSP